MARQKPIRRKPKIVKRACSYCLEKKSPDFKDYEVLKKFTSERGKILDRQRTGACSKHQRRVTIAVKRARHLALLPFVAGLR